MEDKKTKKEKKRTEKPRMEDVGAFAESSRSRQQSCSYNSFTIVPRFHFINNLMNHPLASKRCKLECLKDLVGEPIIHTSELETVWKKHKDLMMAEVKRREYADRKKAHDELRELKHKVKGFVESNLENAIIANGVKREMNAIARGEGSDGSFIDLLYTASNDTAIVYREFLSEKNN